VHRLVPVGSRILVLGGAAKGQNFDLIEAVSIQPSAAPTAAAPHGARRPAKAQPTAGSAPAPVAPATQPAGDAAAAQLFCPVMTDEPVNASSIVVQYKGKPVRLCCKTCLKKWNADPE